MSTCCTPPSTAYASGPGRGEQLRQYSQSQQLQHLVLFMKHTHTHSEEHTHSHSCNSAGDSFVFSRSESFAGVALSLSRHTKRKQQLATNAATKTTATTTLGVTITSAGRGGARGWSVGCSLAKAAGKWHWLAWHTHSGAKRILIVRNSNKAETTRICVCLFNYLHYQSVAGSTSSNRSKIDYWCKR